MYDLITKLNGFLNFSGPLAFFYFSKLFLSSTSTLLGMNYMKDFPHPHSNLRLMLFFSSNSFLNELVHLEF